nr:hypothetical protein [Streptomyces sp. VMFN-G11Ma]
MTIMVGLVAQNSDLMEGVLYVTVQVAFAVQRCQALDLLAAGVRDTASEDEIGGQGLSKLTGL